MTSLSLAKFGRPLAIAIAAAGALSLAIWAAPRLGADPAHAQSAASGGYTFEDRAAFEAAVRGYLVENPEVIIEALQAFERRRVAAAEERAAETISGNIEALERDGYSFVGGNPEGSITIVEFLDYNCGFCRRAHADVIAILASESDVRFVVKEWPVLGPNSVFAARAAMAALQVGGPEAYSALHNAMMTHNGAVTPAQVRALAESVGLDWAAIEAVMNDETVVQRIAQNDQLAQTIGIEGTPAFIIGGRLVRGAVPREQLLAAIEEARARLTQ